MKKLFVIPLIGVGVLILSLVYIANMNVVNLLVSGTDYGGGGQEQFSPDNLDGIVNHEELASNINAGVSSTTMESLQSGLMSSGGGKLNLLWILQNAADINKESYAYQLLEVYSKLEQGEYNNLTHHVSPEAIAGSHFNETGLSSFVVPSTSGFGKMVSGNLGQTVNGKKLTLENAQKSDVVRSAGTSVWKDANTDGMPDGPFQIESGKQDNSNANKNRVDKVYDLYNFVDAANVVDAKFSKIAAKVAESGATPDSRAISVLFAFAHNRGDSGVGRMMFGLPYSAKRGVINYSNYLARQELGTMNPEELQIALQFPKDFIKWYDNSNIPLEKIAGNVERSRGLAALIVLANGGFINSKLSPASTKAIQSVPDDVIKKLFSGHSRATIVNHINSNFVKKPWDVLKMSRSQYDKIYGSSVINNQYEEIYRFNVNWYNTLFYIDPSVKSTNYKAGENIVVRAVEGIAAGYMIDVGVAGTYVLLEIALEAGIKSLTDGTVVDPSNPQEYYKTIQDNGGETYNPAGAADGNFGKFLDGLGLTGKLTEPQQAQIEAMYIVSGAPYSQPKRGQVYSGSALYLDCSSMATIGLFLDPQIKSYVDTGFIKSGGWLKSTKKTKAVKGVTYDAKVVQLDGNGKPMAPSTSINTAHQKTDEGWLGLLQTGDIVNGRAGNNGHVWTYLGKNNSGKTMVLTQDVSKVGAKFSKYEPGEHFTMQAAYYGTSSGMGLMPLYGDTRKTKIYHAMRPVYNLR